MYMPMTPMEDMAEKATVEPSSERPSRMAAAPMAMMELTGVPVVGFTRFHQREPGMPSSREKAYSMRELAVMQKVPHQLEATNRMSMKARAGLVLPLNRAAKASMKIWDVA